MPTLQKIGGTPSLPTLLMIGGKLMTECCCSVPSSSGSVNICVLYYCIHCVLTTTVSSGEGSGSGEWVTVEEFNFIRANVPYWETWDCSWRNEDDYGSNYYILGFTYPDEWELEIYGIEPTTIWHNSDPYGTFSGAGTNISFTAVLSPCT